VSVFKLDGGSSTAFSASKASSRPVAHAPQARPAATKPVARPAPARVVAKTGTDDSGDWEEF